MNHALSTDGEKLAYYVDTHVVSKVRWDELAIQLAHTGRGSHLAAFYHQATSVSLACRIVAAGSSLLDNPARDISDATFAQDLRTHLRERTMIPSRLVDGVFRVATAAVGATREHIGEKQRVNLTRWARKTHSFCYLCGVPLDFQNTARHTGFTLDHIWPQCYGGNSINDNLLPACVSCNSHKKQDLASWAMANVHAVFLGLSPRQSALASVRGTHRFALYHAAAQRLAMRQQLTLKDAFLRLRNWSDIRVLDEDDHADFFNLANHQYHMNLVEG